jgi:hypothetical protein
LIYGEAANLILATNLLPLSWNPEIDENQCVLGVREKQIVPTVSYLED